MAQRATNSGTSTSAAANGPITVHSAAITRPSAAYPRSEATSSDGLDSSWIRRDARPSYLVIWRTPQIRPWLTKTCAAAAAANGQMIAGKLGGPGRPMCPPSTTNALPAAKPATAYIPPLNTRSARRVLRRTLIRDTAPTSAAPSGPSSTTAARVADELGDQAACRAASGVGVESQIRNKSMSTPSTIHQLRLRGRSESLGATTEAAAITTAPM